MDVNPQALMQLVNYGRSAPEDQQMQMLIGAFNILAPKYSAMSAEQAKTLSSTLLAEGIFDEQGNINEELFMSSLNKFKEQAIPAAPTRFVCENCGTLRKVK